MCLYTYAIHEYSLLGPSRTYTDLNRFVRMLTSRPNTDLNINIYRKQALLSTDLKKAMLEAENKKAEILDMIRLKETLR